MPKIKKLLAKVQQQNPWNHENGGSALISIYLPSVETEGKYEAVVWRAELDDGYITLPNFTRAKDLDPYQSFSLSSTSLKRVLKDLLIIIARENESAWVKENSNMKEDIKELWLQALRSGDYHQGHSVLRKGDTYCCLGVLCDLYLKQTGEGSWEPSGDTYSFVVGDDEVGAFLPEAVKNWAGLDSHSPLTKRNGQTLVYFNDNQRLSFSGIANIIEEDF